MSVELLPRIYLMRHGETEWSRSGQHTSSTDLPLTSEGEAQAMQLGELIRKFTFDHVLTGPLLRARRTCELARLGPMARVDASLREWEYGEYEGLTSVEIRRRQPGWDVFQNGCPGGESPDQMCRRVDEVVTNLQRLNGNIAIFSHGHFLRALAVRWLGLPILEGRHFGLKTASLSILGHEHNDRNEPAIEMWNVSAVDFRRN